MPLLDHKGQPMAASRTTQDFKKAAPPILGDKFAPRWAGEGDRHIFQFPGGGTVMFDLSRLTLADFRAMRDHYQVNATLSVLTFMVHQMEWRIECDSTKQAKFITENLKEVWTSLVRSLSQAFWAGYSPSAIEWENDLNTRNVRLKKIKDLVPEEASVNWKEKEGYAPPQFQVKPKIKVYDGIKVMGQGWPIPVNNTFWYPLMMENGDYYGKKLLRPVFTSWYFSILMHLFSNRYFERFGQPVPIGRAPYEEEIAVGNTKMNGVDLMLGILQNFRSGSAVVLPNERSVVGNGTGAGSVEFDYAIEYLESQMRGADFERYLMRLDEEISIGLFTPLLILRTADVGSYSLGSTHWNLYLNMLNAIVGDIKSYLDPYILGPMVDYNFGVNAPRARIVFRKMGHDKLELVKMLLQNLVSGDKAKPDLKELGDIAGLSFEEIEQVLADPAKPGGEDPNADPNADPKSGGKPAAKDAKSDGKSKAGGNPPAKKTTANSRRVIGDIAGRVSAQANRFIKAGAEGENFAPSVGYSRQLMEALDLDGIEDAASVGESLLGFAGSWLADLPWEYVRNISTFGMLQVTQNTLEDKLEELVNA